MSSGDAAALLVSECKSWQQKGFDQNHIEKTITLSLDQADAAIGRPLTPLNRVRNKAKISALVLETSKDSKKATFAAQTPIRMATDILTWINDAITKERTRALNGGGKHALFNREIRKFDEIGDRSRCGRDGSNRWRFGSSGRRCESHVQSHVRLPCFAECNIVRL